MYYEINVALNGKHLFATHERSIRSEWKLLQVLRIFEEKFPESDGYSILVTECWKEIKEIDIKEVLK